MRARVSIPAWGSAAAALLAASCAGTPAPGFSATSSAWTAHAEFCEAVRTFALAPLDAEELRRAEFLPMGLDPDVIDMQAPMRAEPSDDVANEFYDRVGGLTHHVAGARLGEALSSCFRGRGFVRRAFSKSEDAFQAIFQSDRRRIEIEARDQTATILISGALGADD